MRPPRPSPHTVLPEHDIGGSNLAHLLVVARQRSKKPTDLGRSQMICRTDRRFHSAGNEKEIQR